MTIDGIPLSPAANSNLNALVRVGGDAQQRAQPDKRAPLDDVAVSVIAAFKRSHQIVRGMWEPMPVITLAGGAIVPRP